MPFEAGEFHEKSCLTYNSILTAIQSARLDLQGFDDAQRVPQRPGSLIRSVRA